MDMNFSRDASSFTHMQRGFGNYCLRAVVASCMALAVAMGPSLAWADGSKGKHNATQHHLINHQRMEELKQRIAALRQQQGTAGSTSTDALAGLQAKVTSLESSVAALISANTTLLSAITALQNENLPTRVATLESAPAGSGGGVPGLEKYVTIKDANVDMNGVKGPHLILHGVNVHVVSDSNATIDTTGLGNLIIGYNENSPSGTLNRTGSHNLVGGTMNSFSSSGGLVFGASNTVNGRFSSILGGQNNTLGGSYSTVYGAQFGQSNLSFDYLPAFPVVGN